MTKSKIITNTLIFIIIVAYISIFKGVFGEANSVVGVTIITAVLMLLQRDLTADPLKNLVILLVVNIITGVFSYISAMNLWIGIPLNLIALFSIAYLFSSNIRALVVVPFGLQYLFMLFAPVTGVDFEKRIFALIFGAFFIMGVQLLANKKKLEKSFNESIVSIIDSLIDTIDLPKNLIDPSPQIIDSLVSILKDDKEMGSAILEKIDALKKIVYDKRKKGFYLNKGMKEVVDIVWILERISLNLDKKSIYKNKEFNNYIRNYLLEIKSNIKNKKFNVSYKGFDGKLDNEILEIIKNIDDLAMKINKLVEIENIKKHDFHIKVPKHFESLEITKRNFKIDSLRVSYGVRLAVLGAITIFITEFFNLQEGKWMVFTIFALVQPYQELSKSKAKDRIEGTIIGVILVVIVFIVFKNTQVRLLSVLLVGYLNPFATRYRNVVICVTFSAIASIAVTQNTTVYLAINRLLFVGCGMIIALLGTKYIIPYNIENNNEDIIKNYEDLEVQLKKDIESGEVEDGIKLLYILPAFFEEKLKALNSGKRLVELKEFTRNQRIIINNLYEKYYSRLNKINN
ncbi:MAG: FUSC family protein [Clostridium perfringens]|nr:FUSC family protein [Clostridium perfringens]